MSLTLSNSDIISTLEMLAGEILRAKSGTTTSLQSDALGDIDNVDGFLLVFLNGGLMNQETYIDHFIDVINIASFTEPVTEEVTSATKFAYLETGYESFIKRAEDILQSLFRNKGLDIDLFLNDAQLKQLRIYKTIELICLSKRQDATDTDIYHSNYISFRELFSQEFSSLVADYDSNENGIIDDAEEKQKIGQVSFSR